MSPDEFQTAIDRLRSAAPRDSQLAEPFVELFQVSGTSVSTIGDLLGSQTVAATNRQAARLDEVQFDLGEGPCWDAIGSGAPVLEPDFRTRGWKEWPAFTAAIAADPVTSLFAFPMLIGPLKVGAIDLYAASHMELGDVECRRAAVMADVVGRRILEAALADTAEEYREDTSNPFSRRLVHQATGMVLAQLGVSADDAVLVMQAHAFGTGLSMMDVANRILDGELDFSVHNGSIEDSQ
jgi:hypothetical protein